MSTGRQFGKVLLLPSAQQTSGDDLRPVDLDCTVPCLTQPVKFSITLCQAFCSHTIALPPVLTFTRADSDCKLLHAALPSGIIITISAGKGFRMCCPPQTGCCP